jgi:y4mF family transcriptional regulator
MSRPVGQIVRFHRKKAGLSQQQLAELAGLGKTVVFDVEKGKMSIRYETLLKLLNVLNIEIQFHGPLMKLCEEQLNENS